MTRRRGARGPLEAVADPLPELPTGATLSEDALRGSHPAILLPRLLALSEQRRDWLSDRLAEQIRAEGLDGLVGTSHGLTPDGERVQLGEFVRALATAEAAERDRAASLAERVARLGLDQGQAERDVAGWVIAALEHLIREFGWTLADDAVRRAARRAGMAGRQAMGHADSSPELMGPPLQAQERVDALAVALERAQRQAVEVAVVTGRESGGPWPTG